MSLFQLATTSRRLEVSRLLTTDVGELWYHSDDPITSIVYEQGAWERPEGDLIKTYLHKGDTFVDVGAHVGYFSAMAAQLVGLEGSVIAIEPAEENATLLAMNLESYTNCIMICAAAWKKNALLELYCSSINSGDNRLFDHADSIPPVNVPAFSLDGLGLKRLDVLKLDAQGTDHIILSGARNTINICKPLIIVEWWPEGIRRYGHDPLRVLKFYENIGYEISGVGVNELPFTDGYCSLLLEPK